MKKILFIVFSLLILSTGCRKFEPATISLDVAYDKNTGDATCNAKILDDGGCPYFTEQGICFSLYETPSHTDEYSQIEIVNKGTEELTFSTVVHLSLADSYYYVRAYVKTNAGIAYSDIIEVSTFTE